MWGLAGYHRGFAHVAYWPKPLGNDTFFVVLASSCLAILMARSVCTMVAIFIFHHSYTAAARVGMHLPPVVLLARGLLAFDVVLFCNDALLSLLRG